LRRREFIAGLGAAAAWPVVARAQQAALPVVGYLQITSPEAGGFLLAAFRKGLGEIGYVEGRNVGFELRWADNQFDRLPALAADLVRHQVAVIFANGPTAVLAAKAASATIPIVFTMGEDPVKEAVVASLNRPGGNVTGFTDFGNQLAGKRLGPLREILPQAAVFALLVNPANPNAESDSKDARAAADALGLELRVLTASTERELETAFAVMVQLQVDALVVNVDPFFGAQREQLAALAARHAVPALSDRRNFPAEGGLISYGTDRSETNRQAGIYVGRILKGEKPSDLPVQQSTKIELIINLSTARSLGLTIPETLLATADEVIQ
jgi:putative tryptophan/tyrosine transport system substrate-binding protein